MQRAFKEKQLATARRAWAKQRSPDTGMIDYYARLAAEQAGGGDCLKTRLLVPAGTTTVYLRDGSCPVVRDGVIAVPESEVAPLLVAGFVRLQGALTK